MALDEIRQDRIRKIERYEAAGYDAYPASVKRNFLIGGVRGKFSSLVRSKKKLTIAGRIRAWREHGGATFADLEDASGAIQLYFSHDDLGKLYELALATIDIGDFVEATGRAYETKRTEPTVKISSWRIIAKSLLPLPEKWHGLKDVEERFRKRYLDLLMNRDVRERFLLRSNVVSALRDFFNTEGFLEVETPMLQDIPGGALARPFKTRHNALAIDLYLRIAPELYLKKLLVGGFERVYELGKSFRNEGVDVTHNPEFTTIEWYAAYWDENDMMACVERCFRTLFKRLSLKNKISFDEKEIRFGAKFPRLEFTEVLKRHAQILEYDKETRDSLAAHARHFGIEARPGDSKGKIADAIYKKVCRPHLIAPTFVTHHPLEISPLAKRVSTASGNVRRFQLIVGGLEMVNAFAELNNPLDQRARFEEQLKLKSAGDQETHPWDEGFIEALEYGMPPAAGAAIGIDRLVMLLTDTRNIREVVLFPTLRPKAS